MKLERLTERVWIYPFEEARDRPNLGYIRGDRWSLAVDAGHSAAHVAEFYGALEAAGLPLPALTAITHWHWDHTFGMHAARSLCLCGARTDARLRDFRARIDREGREAFLALDEKIRAEYAGDTPIVVAFADLVVPGELLLDAGGCPIRLFPAESPHTDDSMLVFAEGEGALFLGDAACGVFPTWERDAALSRRLADTIEATGAALCVEGHCPPASTRETVRGLREEEFE